MYFGFWIFDFKVNPSVSTLGFFYLYYMEKQIKYTRVYTNEDGSTDTWTYDWNKNKVSGILEVLSSPPPKQKKEKKNKYVKY